MISTDDDADSIPAPWTYLALTSWWTVRHGLGPYVDVTLSEYIERCIKGGNYREDIDG